MRLRLPIALATFALLVGTTGARAQDEPRREVAQGPWLVVGTVPLFGRAEIARAAVELSAPDMIPGAVVVRPAEAVERFEAAHSRPPIARSSGEIAELERCAREMNLQLARGRIAAAGTHLARCEELLIEVRRTYDVQRQTEQRVFRACLVLLQGLLASGPHDRAREHAELCRLDAVDLPVEREWASPEVQELMSEVDAALELRPRAVVRVYGTVDECDVWLRGRMIGRTPLVVHGVLAGPATLQLICAGRPPGRAHHVTLLSGENSLEIDHVLETALRTDSAIVVDYGSTWIESVRRLDDARVIAEAVGARVVVLATILPSRDAIRLDRVDLLGGERLRVNASVMVPVSAEGGTIVRPEDLGLAGRALAELRSIDLRTDPPREMAPWAPRRPRSE